VKRDNFRLIFGLSQTQPWIKSKIDKLESLLFDDCNTTEQRNLIIELINSFVYLSNSKFIECLKTLSETIVTEPGINDFDTQVVAMAADSGSDSSQYILYALKPYFEELGWREYKQVNKYSLSYRTYNRSNDHKNIVLIDEFIGSGQTVINRVKDIESSFISKKVTDFTIRARVILATEEGIDNARKNGIDVESQIILKKGITDHFPTHEIGDKLDLMKQLEGRLSSEYKGRKMPSLGYGGTESLYARDEGNTPNSVFPIFWWPFYNDETSRLTLLTRAMSDA